MLALISWNSVWSLPIQAFLREQTGGIGKFFGLCGGLTNHRFKGLQGCLDHRPVIVWPRQVNKWGAVFRPKGSTLLWYILLWKMNQRYFWLLGWIGMWKYASLRSILRVKSPLFIVLRTGATCEGGASMWEFRFFKSMIGLQPTDAFQTRNFGIEPGSVQVYLRLLETRDDLFQNPLSLSLFSGDHISEGKSCSGGGIAKCSLCTPTWWCLKGSFVTHFELSTKLLSQPPTGNDCEGTCPHLSCLYLDEPLHLQMSLRCGPSCTLSFCRLADDWGTDKVNAWILLWEWKILSIKRLVLKLLFCWRRSGWTLCTLALE